jgi:hypothetical protein
MLPTRFDAGRKCRKCSSERKTCKNCGRCQQHCRCEDGPLLLRRIEFSGSGCTFHLIKGDDEDSVDLVIRDREGKDVVSFKDIWIFHLGDLAEEVILNEPDSYSSKSVVKEILKQLSPSEMEVLFQDLPDERLRVVRDVIKKLCEDINTPDV